MSWKTFILGLPIKGAGIKTWPPVTEAQFLRFSELFSLELPQELSDLYHETNGLHEYIDDMYIGEFILEFDELIEENKHLQKERTEQEEHHPSTAFLFFARAGNGDLFAYEIDNETIQSNAIIAWNHEDDSVKIVARNLKSFVREWLMGQISI